MPLIPEPQWAVNPAFDRHPAEARWIGKILAACGELEFMAANLAADAIGKWDSVLRSLYRLRATSSRLEIADALTRPELTAISLEEEHAHTHSMLLYSLKLRNQYAHCNWGDDHRVEGLFFVDLQNAASSHFGFPYNEHWRFVDVDLLEWQYVYVTLTMEWLRYLESRLRLEKDKSAHKWPMPPRPIRPPLHRDQLKYVPPWLNGDALARYLARAKATAGGAPAPTPAQQAIDARRAEKKAKRDADRQRGLEAQSAKKEEP